MRRNAPVTEKHSFDGHGFDNPGHHFDDRTMETIMGRLLQVGVLLASAVILVGAAIYLASHQARVADYRVFVSEPETLRNPASLPGQIRHGAAPALIQLGVLLLIATPVARVVFAVVAFLIERDWLYTMISVGVLGVLIFGLLHGT